MSRLTARAGTTPDQWHAAPSKFSNLRMLVERGLSVPPTLEVCEDDLSDLGARAAALSRYPADIWMLRFDGDPSIRFAVEALNCRTGDLPQTIKHAWSSRPSRDLRILVQQKLARRTDGIAVRTAADVVVVESQFDRPGNFYRDGSVPSRWMFEAGKPESDAIEGLPRTVAVELSRALRLLPPALCVEWVLTVDDVVHFVDAKPLPEEFLVELTPGDVRNECTPVVSGSAIGVIHASAGSGEDPTIHLADRTHVDTLLEIGSRSRGVAFRSGGLLSHAVVYCAQLALPLVMCPAVHVEQGLERTKYKLTVGRKFHELTRC